MSTIIHPTAIVSDKARIGENVTIGPFSIVEENVQIGDNSEIRSSVVLAKGTRIGENTKVYSGTIIGTEPQDLKYNNEETYAIIGNNCVIREYVTINRGTNHQGTTIVGDDTLIMTYSHIAHDCTVGSNVIMSNATQLAGHVTIGEYCVIGGMVKVHQFCTVGKYSMVAADAMVVKDITPFALTGREPVCIEGVNKIGLRRRGFGEETIASIEQFYKRVFFNGLNTTDGVEKYISTQKEILPEVQECIDFIRLSKRGIYRG